MVMKAQTPYPLQHIAGAIFEKVYKQHPKSINST